MSETHKVIFLIPDDHFDSTYCWCEDPAPGIGMDEEDAIKYIRADQLETLEAQNKALFAALARLGDDYFTDQIEGEKEWKWLDRELTATKEYANTEIKRIEGMGDE